MATTSGWSLLPLKPWATTTAPIGAGGVRTAASRTTPSSVCSVAVTMVMAIGTCAPRLNLSDGSPVLGYRSARVTVEQEPPEQHAVMFPIRRTVAGQAFDE